MAAPNPYSGGVEDFDPDNHWGSVPGLPDVRTYTGESIGSFDPSGEGIYSAEAGEESMIGVVDSSRVRGFMRYCLGYNNMATSGTYRLQRTNPICHPRFTNLVCTGVSHRPFKPRRSDAETTVLLGTTNNKLKLSRNDGTSGVVCSAEIGGGTAHTFPYYAGYQKELCTIRFSPAPYRYAQDADITYEYHRNTIIDTEPRTEVLTLSGYQVIYAEGGSNTGNLTNAKGKSAPGDLYQVLVRPDIKVTWFQVPEKFLTTNTTIGQMYPNKILAGLGKVNNATWLTYPKGTLLFNGARLTRKPWALAAGGSAAGTPPTDLRESVFNYDVEFLFSYFNPVKGYDTDAQITNADTYGHNCLPYRGEPTGTTIATDDLNAGRWFFATYSGQLNSIGTANGSRGLLEYTSFNNLFSSAWAPDI